MVKDIYSHDYFKEALELWTREEIIQRCYELCQECIEKDKKINEAIKFINDITIEPLNELEKYKLIPFKKCIIGERLLDILGEEK